MEQLFVQWVPEVKVRALHGIIHVVGRFRLFFEAVKVLVVEDAHLVILVANDFGQIVNWEGATGCQNDVSRKVRILQRVPHDGDVGLRQIESFEYDGVAHALHAIFDQVLIVVLVTAHVKVLGRYFGDDEFDIEMLRELL
jgi:hypothetical protein